MKINVTRVGNSLRMTLQQEVLTHLKIQQGDKIKFRSEENGKSVKKNNRLNNEVLEGIEQDFLDGMNDLFENYDKTLRNIADR
ncbi:AbrB family transcriptional regulator [Psychrobacillus antarcticus]|uniref:AbrB family transcriptional regulator n=1 Tax=Psychrobacillus antarcticus TaxID=2879115 RepID=UPI0024087AFF|nr:AbrB family transcriptional regulator [Psychrobacillus antarcticus]